MKNKYTVLPLVFLLASCDFSNSNFSSVNSSINVNTSSTQIESSSDKKENTSTMVSSSNNNNNSSNNNSSDNNKSDFVNNGIDEEAFEFYTNLESLTETGLNANTLIDNAFEYLNSKDKTLPVNYSRREPRYKKDTLIESGIDLQYANFVEKNSNLSTFVSNIINIKKSVFQLDGKLASDEYYSCYDGATDINYYHCYDNKLIYASLDAESDFSSLNNIWYFSLEYNEEDNAYYYFALSWSQYGGILYNESDLRTYSIIYSDQFNGSSKNVVYYDLMEVEERFDELGNANDFSEYGENAYKHQYFEHVKAYTGTDSGYLNEHISQCVSNIYDYSMTLKRSEMSSYEAIDLVNQAPMINTAYYYLTNGYKLPIIDMILINEDKKETVAIVEPIIYHTNNEGHFVVLFTENNAMEFEPSIFCDDFYNLEKGVHNISFDILGKITYELECIVLNDEYYGNGFDYWTMVNYLIPYYSKSEFVQRYIKAFTLSSSEFYSLANDLLLEIDTLVIEDYEPEELDLIKNQMKSYIETLLSIYPFSSN